MSRILLELEKFLALSEAMANAAEAQEWESLVRFGKQRDLLSDKLPSNLGAQLPPTEQLQAGTIIERCQHLDGQIRTLVDERQKTLRVLLREPKPVT